MEPSRTSFQVPQFNTSSEGPLGGSTFLSLDPQHGFGFPLGFLLNRPGGRIQLTRPHRRFALAPSPLPSFPSRCLCLLAKPRGRPAVWLSGCLSCQGGTPAGRLLSTGMHVRVPENWIWTTLFWVSFWFLVSITPKGYPQIKTSPHIVHEYIRIVLHSLYDFHPHTTH